MGKATTVTIHAPGNCGLRSANQAALGEGHDGHHPRPPGTGASGPRTKQRFETVDFYRRTNISEVYFWGQSGTPVTSLFTHQSFFQLCRHVRFGTPVVYDVLKGTLTPRLLRRWSFRSPSGGNKGLFSPTFVKGNSFLR